MSGSSQTVLSLTVLGEACREDESVLQINSLGALAALVGHGLLLDIAVPGVDPSDLLVLAGEDDLAAIPVEGGGQDELGQGEVDEALPGADVPHADIVVAAAGEEDVLGGGV